MATKRRVKKEYLEVFLSRLAEYNYVEIYHDGICWNIDISDHDDNDRRISVYADNLMTAVNKVFSQLHIEDNKLKI